MKPRRRHPSRLRTNLHALLAGVPVETVPKTDAKIDTSTILILLREHNLPHHANVLSLRLCGYTHAEVAQALSLTRYRVQQLEQAAHTLARSLI